MQTTRLDRVAEGLDFEEFFREEYPGLVRALFRLRQNDGSVLEPGNVLHAILGMWMEEWGVEVSETVLVTEAGCEAITRFPRELYRK